MESVNVSAGVVTEDGAASVFEAEAFFASAVGETTSD